MGLNTKKALYFTTDAVLAAMLILAGFALTYKLTTTHHQNTNIDYLSEDLLNALDTIPLSSINHPFVQAELTNGNITNPQNSVLEQIAEYWAKNEETKAQQLTEIVLNNTLPEELGFSLSMQPDQLYEQTRNLTNNRIAARRMVSGIDKGKPLIGSSSYGYLRSIKDKKTSAYAYYGGFVGQGNITVQLEPLPEDVNSTRIRNITLEADLKRNFSIQFNNNHCADLAPSTGNMTADTWDLTSCKGSLTKGINNITINFKDFEDAYIGGGYLRVDYETDYFQTAKNYEETTYYFPDIKGIINLYDAFDVPGTLNEMEIMLHYLANHTNASNNPFYLTIGNKTIYTDTNTTDITTITLSNTALASMLNYTLLSNTTVPLRLGFENLTYSTEYIGNADVIIITDVSGSMDWNFTSTSSGIKRNCDDPYINEQSTQRLSVAKCLDKDFATDILDVEGNRLGLVSYESSTDETLGLGTDLVAIYNEIGLGTGSPTGYTASGGTCICCGINSAYDELTTGVTATTYINTNENYNYTNNYYAGNIPNDANNRTWYDPDYALENTWASGPAVLGHDYGIGGTPIDTELGSQLAPSIMNISAGMLIDTWELKIDNNTPQTDFTSGLNSTANTFGLGAGNDGWDWADGTFDYAGGFDNHDVWNGRLRLSTPQSGWGDSSGSFGVTINITDEQYAIINTATGKAQLQFDYAWEHVQPAFESNDQVWIKGRFHTQSTSHWLGKDLDGTHDGGDGTPEIATSENPNDNIAGTYNENLKNLITGPGTYYLELGGKLDRSWSWSSEYGHFYFDDILFIARNDTQEARAHYPDLWELAVDRDTLPVDFSSGLNSTANTFGLGAGNDGWDWADGTYDYPNGMDWYNVYNSRLTMRSHDSDSTDQSGAFGVTINITDEHYAIINKSGTAMLSFDYWWDDYQNYYEDDDQVWIKGRFHTPTNTYWLGEHLDEEHTNADPTPEIDAKDNPNVDIVEEHYATDLAGYIDQPGLYYLELGGKLRRSASNEWGIFQFDNILLEIRNTTDHYYFRKHFTINDLNTVKRGFINVLADDEFTAYINGNKITTKTQPTPGDYWDHPGINIPGNYFKSGKNVLAIELRNSHQSARFDLQLIGINDSQQKAMMVMTDGQANSECARQGWTPDLDGDGYTDSASDDAIQAACDASTQYGIKVYAVGFSEDANEATLRGIAECGNGLYRKSYNTSQLQIFYQDVVLNILELSKQSQTIVVEAGTPADSRIYGDSYIRINHTQTITPPAPNEIELVFQTPPLANCTTQITIPNGLRIAQSHITSYSADHWTSLVAIDDTTVFNLSVFAPNYSRLGDPYKVTIPPEILTQGTHNITIQTGDDNTNTTGCSPDNSLIYKAFLNSSTTRSTVVDKAEGCRWTVEFEDGNNQTFNVPTSYTGTKTCSYTNASLVYDKQDAYDLAVHSLMNQLDFDKDHRVFVNLAAGDLEIIVTLINDVPYLWGPAIMEVTFWQ